MKRSHLLNLFLIVFLNVLVKPFWIFGIDMKVNNMVGAESYGLYFSLFSFSIMLNMILDMGISNYNNRRVSQNSEVLSRDFGHIVGLRLLLGVTYLVVCFIVAGVVGYNAIQFHLLAILAINQFLAMLILYLRSNIAALQKFTLDSVLSVLDRFLMIFICGIVLYSGYFDEQFNIFWFAYLQTFSYILSALIIWFQVKRVAGKSPIKISLIFSRRYLKACYPYAILTFLMSLYIRIQPVFIERFLPGNIGFEQAGIFAQAFRLFDAAGMFGLLFAGMLLPIFSKMIQQKEDLTFTTQSSFSIVLILGAIISTIFYFWATPIIDLCYKQHVQEASSIFQLISFALIPMYTTYVFGTLLTANGSLKALNIMAGVGVGLNVILSIVLIPKLQGEGAALVFAITQIFTALVQVVLAMKLLKIKFRFQYYLSCTVFVVGTFLLGHYTHDLCAWYYSIFIFGSLSLLFVFITRMVTPADIKKILIK